QLLAGYQHLILANARPPVGFFAYPGKPSHLHAEGAMLHVLSRMEQDAHAALQALGDELGVPPVEIPDSGLPPPRGRGPPTREGFAATVAAVLPEQAIVVDESVSFGRGFFSSSHAAAPHDWVQIVGG